MSVRQPINPANLEKIFRWLVVADILLTTGGLLFDLAFALWGGPAATAAQSVEESVRDRIVSGMAVFFLMVYLPAVLAAWAGLLARMAWGRWLYLGASAFIHLAYLPVSFIDVGDERYWAFTRQIDGIGGLVEGAILALLFLSPVAGIYRRDGRDGGAGPEPTADEAAPTAGPDEEPPPPALPEDHARTIPAGAESAGTSRIAAVLGFLFLTMPGRFVLGVLVFGFLLLGMKVVVATEGRPNLTVARAPSPPAAGAASASPRAASRADGDAGARRMMEQMKQAFVQQQASACRFCNGTGREPCVSCMLSGAHHGICLQCNGTGYSNTPCHICGGTGRTR